jgi:hypothetical protein
MRDQQKFLGSALAALSLLACGPALAQVSTDPAVQNQINQNIIQQQSLQTQLNNLQLQQSIQQDRIHERQMQAMTPPVYLPPPHPVAPPPPRPVTPAATAH